MHQISESPLHLAKEDLRFGNLKFVPKGEDNEVFGMPLPNELITNKFRNAPYYNAYLEMKIRKGKSSLQLIDEDEPTQPEPEPEPEHQGEGDEYDVERAIQMSLESFQSQSQAHDDASANIVRESSTPADAETSADIDKTNSGRDTKILQIGEEQGEDV
ncbi:hypothetical protein Tco_0094327, partial [Tanacetum coccineum]